MSIARHHQQQAMNTLQCAAITAWHKHSHTTARLHSAAIAFAAKRLRCHAVNALHKLQLVTRQRKGKYLKYDAYQIIYRCTCYSTR
jgi:hypothetical protein